MESCRQLLIYIPLCFYFITRLERNKHKQNKFTFHYASTLSSGNCSSYWSKQLIYIPLCFYFIRRVIYLDVRWPIIYIPLCFYFINKAALYKDRSCPFTFHYASTLSMMRPDLVWTDTHLHSTMLLLYRNRTDRKGSADFIYIPLCFYFISFITSLPSRALQIYIPLCFYFIVYSRKSRVPFYLIYIPLCFYFIAPSMQGILHSTLIYIPLCFYFIGNQAPCNAEQEIIYIPLCFYFIHTRIMWNYTLRHIYIPLCFYFIGDGPCKTGTCSSYLHSTMLLLYRDTPVMIARRAATFTFHYASTLSAKRTGWGLWFYIYIPLCFYFICRRQRLSDRNVQFTFHYASTLSNRTAGACWTCREFTFHYASTLSYLPYLAQGLNLRIYIPLCFYFIELSEVFCPAMRIIYIPLCFYFIWFFLPDIMTILSHLHSTMLLLYRSQSSSSCPDCAYLHSTMLLLYRDAAARDMLMMSIYIPLCFYFIPSPFSPSTFFNTVILFVYPLSA